MIIDYIIGDYLRVYFGTAAVDCLKISLIHGLKVLIAK